MNIAKLITVTVLTLFISSLSLTAQTSGGLKQVEKEGKEVTKDKAPLKVKQNKSEMSEEDVKDIAEAKERANKGQMNDSFKKKKSKIDKANAKVAQLTAKFKAKVKSGEWTKEKFDKMMQKVGAKEKKIAQKKLDLVNSLKKK